jgi:hypothetical protein
LHPKETSLRKCPTHSFSLLVAVGNTMAAPRGLGNAEKTIIAPPTGAIGAPGDKPYTSGRLPFSQGGAIVSGAFDPYHRWLGIPLKDQPANHYRLLGLDLCEADTEVIRDAAEQRMAHVRTYQLGQYAELSQRILNELAVAKACLLDAAKRTAYDATLKKRVRRPPETPAASENSYSIMPADAVVQRPSASRANGRTEGANPHAESPVLAVASQKSGLRKPGNRPAVDRGRPEDTSFPPTLPDLPYPRTHKRSAGPQKSWIVSGGIVAVAVVALGSILFFHGHQDVVGSSDSESRSPGLTDQRQVDKGNGGPKAANIPVPVVRPPKLAPIKDCTVDEDTLIQFRPLFFDLGTSSSLRYAIEPGAPAGAAIDARSGLFSWRPSREQAPGEYRITLRVMAEGQNGVGDKVAFRVCVRRVVMPPVIRPVGDQTVRAGTSARFRILVTDFAGPPETLVFSLPQAPSWVSIDPVTGMVTCSPDQTVSPERYSVTACAVSDKEERLRGEMTFGVFVAIPRLAKPSRTGGDLAPGVFTIRLPSGKRAASTELLILDRVRNEISALETKCRENASGVIGSYQEGSQSEIAALSNVKGLKLYGATILFHSHSMAAPKEYITYRNGTLHGEVASWDEQGQQQFWCNYASGQRDGLCCLFKHDLLAMVLECARNKTTAVHLITDNEITKSFTAVEEARGNNTAGPLLQEIMEIEDRLKADERAYRDRVTQAMHLKVGLNNQKKRDEFRRRSQERGAAEQQWIDTLHKAGSR